ncbi:Uma2 family endonuclease [Planctomycetaceae bacterium SH139]
MSEAFRYLPHYTVADYETWQGDWELWQGIPVAMTPSPFGIHQRVGKNLVFEIERQIRAQKDCTAVVLYEIDWLVAEDTVVRPDVLVICGEPPVGHVEHPPTLVAEILSPSTATRDREAKRWLYEENGVGIYLLIDPDTQTLEIFRRTSSDAWHHESIQTTVALSVCENCSLQLQRSALFR